MKIYYYCQHILGMGHFFRSLEICRALKDHHVFLLSGGQPVDVELPGHVREIRLPGLMMDEAFSTFISTDTEKSVEQVQADRRKLLFDLFQDGAPDLFIIELFPFGRNAFRFELNPILDAIKNGEIPPCCVACSLRDVLVEKKYQAAYEERVLGSLNGRFHALLVHADRNLIRLDRTFGRVGDIRIPVVYTGFVTRKPDPGARERVRGRLGLSDRDRLVVASAGGGKVGYPLLKSVVEAAPSLESRGRTFLQVFTGPFMDDDLVTGLQTRAHGSCRVERFTASFPDWLAAADLSVSMAGYNTCINILAARTRALVWPFEQNREQRLRAETLAGRGALDVLDEGDLEPSRLAERMAEALARPVPGNIDVNLDGADRTAAWLNEWMGKGSRS